MAGLLEELTALPSSLSRVCSTWLLLLHVSYSLLFLFFGVLCLGCCLDLEVVLVDVEDFDQRAVLVSSFGVDF